MNKIKFIIVDDDPINNKLCRHILNITVPNSEITDYLLPFEALDFIKNNKDNNSKNKIIILLDLNMPMISGWDFLEIFRSMDESIKTKYKIHILSSSIDNRDLERAKNNKYVCSYISKPLTKEKIKSILIGLEDDVE